MAKNNGTAMTGGLERLQDILTVGVLAGVGIFMAAVSFKSGRTAGETAGIAAAWALYIMSLSSLLCGELNLGMIPQAFTALLVFLIAAYHGLPYSGARTAVICIVSLLTVLRIVYIAVSVVMLRAAKAPSAGDARVLLVLGARMRNGKPGKVMRSRLDKAIEILNKNENAVCVLTGGRLNPNEPAEAEVMRDYLLAHGIDGSRLLTEANSTTTYENMSMSRAILEREGLGCSVGIVTNGFHQFRAQRIAKASGLEPTPVNSPTPWQLAVQYWLREVLCVLQMLVTMK